MWRDTSLQLLPFACPGSLVATIAASLMPETPGPAVISVGTLPEGVLSARDEPC
jgi:hypothetical protein